MGTLEYTKQVDDEVQLIEDIKNQYGVKIRYDVGNKAIPVLWRTPPANGTAQPMGRNSLCRFVPMLLKELKKYPPDVVRHIVATIYLLDYLSFYGIEYGGTSLAD